MISGDIDRSKNIEENARHMNVDLNELEERAEAVAERLQAFGRYL